MAPDGAGRYVTCCNGWGNGRRRRAGAAGAGAGSCEEIAAEYMMLFADVAVPQQQQDV